MRINELLLEQEQLDELSLSGLGQGIKKAATKTAQVGADAVGGALGGLAGAWNRGKAAYQRGKAAVDPDGNPQDPDGNPQQPTTAPTTNAGSAPQVTPGTAHPATAPAPADASAPAVDPAQATAPADASAPATPATEPVPAAEPAKTTVTTNRVGVPAGKQAVDQAVATVQSVRSDRRPQVIQYAKQKVDALAQQAAKPKAPSQAEIDADRARLMGADNGGSNESVGYSRFLGMVL